MVGRVLVQSLSGVRRNWPHQGRHVMLLLPLHCGRRRRRRRKVALFLRCPDNSRRNSLSACRILLTSSR